jgi:hypothetical protein
MNTSLVYDTFHMDYHDLKAQNTTITTTQKLHLISKVDKSKVKLL